MYVMLSSLSNRLFGEYKVAKVFNMLLDKVNNGYWLNGGIVAAFV